MFTTNKYLFRGLNLLGLQSKVAFEKVENNFNAISSNNLDNTNNADLIKKQYSQSKKLILDSVKISKKNLISQRLKVVFISILICFALKLIQTIFLLKKKLEFIWDNNNNLELFDN